MNRQNVPKKKKEKKTLSKGIKTFLRGFGTLCLIGVITGSIVLGAFYYYIVNYLNPKMDVDLNSYKLNYTTYVYAIDPTTGTEIELEKLFKDQNREWVNLSDIPKHAQDAAVAIEDERFWVHNGVDWKRTFAAIFNLLTGGDSKFGGSTIPQQVVKNVTGDDEYSIMRKVQEILRALNLNKNYSKEEILEFYLNTAFFSQNTNGLQAAAKVYYNKEAKDLTLAESASIVGITKYPGLYDPFRNPDKNKERQEIILKKMLELGKISESEYAVAKNEELALQKELAIAKREEVQSWFVDEVVNNVISDLMTQKGYTRSYATNLVYMGGLKITTTMNSNIQKAMDEVFRNPASFPKTKGEILPEAAMSIVDPYTGAVLGLVGGRGEKTHVRGWNHATITKRQPGSVIKPVAVYAPAIEYGVITEGSVYDDSPHNVEKRYPKNYDSNSKGFAGRMSIKKAVANSTNTVAMKVMSDMSAERSFEFLTEKLGFTTLAKRETINGKVKTDIGLSLSLGGLTHGMTTLEMSAAYASFANRGVYNKPYTYTQVLSHDGTVLLENTPNPQIAMSEQTAFIVNDLLQGVVNSGTGTPARLKNMPVAGKTGTTDDDKDRWFVGYSPYYVGTVWFGYTQPKVIVVSGGNPALNLWKKVMDKVHTGLDRRDFSKPTGVTQAQYCLDSGKVPTDACRADIRGPRIDSAWYKQGTAPSEPCDVHVFVTIDNESKMVVSPYCPIEQTSKVGMINVRREFPYNITINDSGYTYLPLPEGYSLPPESDVPIYQNLLTPGMNIGSGSTNNHICNYHWGSTYIPPIIENPDAPSIPELPVEPGVPPIEPPIVPPIIPTEPIVPPGTNVPMEPIDPPIH